MEIMLTGSEAAAIAFAQQLAAKFAREGGAVAGPGFKLRIATPHDRLIRIQYDDGRASVRSELNIEVFSQITIEGHNHFGVEGTYIFEAGGFGHKEPLKVQGDQDENGTWTIVVREPSSA